MREACATALLMVLLTGTPAYAEEEVARLSGYGSATTAEFEVESPWILDWRVNTDFPQSLVIEISLMDSLTGFRDGLILKTSYRGNGVKLFKQSGRYRFRVDSTLAIWEFRVKQLTPEEAELYTPRSEN